MPKKTTILSSVLALGFLFHSVCLAQTPPPTPPAIPVVSLKHLPIFMHLSTWTGVHFFTEEGEIKAADLKKTINSLHDYKADELLTRSESERESGLVFTIGGLGSMLAGAVIIGVDPNTKENPNSVDGQQIVGLVLATAGFVGEMIGLFQIGDATADQFNALQRYNFVVYKNCQTSWITPKSQVQADLLTLKF